MAAGDTYTAPADWAANEKPVASTKLNQQVRDNVNVLQLGLNGDGSTEAEGMHLHKSGTLAAIPAPGNAGRLYHTTNEGEITLIDNGTVWVPDGVQILDRDLTEVDVVSDANETTIYSHTIPTIPGQATGVMGETGGFRLTLGGDAQVNVAGTIVLKVKLGGTTVFNSVAFDLTNYANYYKWNWVLTCMNHGVVSSQKWTTALHGMSGVDSFALWLGSSAGGFHGIGYRGIAGDDTNDPLLLDITVDWSAANAALRWRKEMALLEILPGA